MTIATLASALLAAAPVTSPAASEPEVWALAAKVNTVPAYEVYLDRFPRGEHHDEAVSAFYKLQNRPVVYAPPSPPPPVPPPVVTIAPPPLDPCSKLLIDQELGYGDTEEARAFIDARRTNRPADFKAFLARFPKGVCSAQVAGRIAAREARRGRFKPVAGLGPLAPHRLARQIFGVEDYPAMALRMGETGRVAAAWEVAEDGVVEGCRVVESSGSASLDNTTCRLITARLRYDPARDARGVPTRSTDTLSITWTLPPD